MRALLDTSCALRVNALADPRRPAVEHAVEKILRDSGEVVIPPQVLYESWVVWTRPVGVGGSGLSVGTAKDRIRRLRARFTFEPDPYTLMQSWLDLCVLHGVSGKPAHDARLVAFMRARDITAIITLNPSDFRRFPSIQLIVPGASDSAAPQ